MKPKLLFVNQSQYGYHINYFNYCRFLKKNFEITYICWDYSFTKILENDVNIKYVSRNGNIFIRNMRFINEVLKLNNASLFNYVFIKYFRGCAVLSFLGKKNQIMHLDIVTGSVSRNIIARMIYNFMIRTESIFFMNISVISEGLKRYLKISEKAIILPLGANELLVNRKIQHKACLIYIGTLNKRQIEDTVEGLGVFIKKFPQADVHYIIIGKGWGDEIQKIKSLISKYNLSKKVELPGYIPYYELKQYFEKANVGISYIPLKPWYEYQPATKTFEYLLSGMPVIATNTYENRKIINKKNGFLINDNSTSFAECLESIYDNLNGFNESEIKKTVEDYKWEIIISNLEEYIFRKLKLKCL